VKTFTSTDEILAANRAHGHYWFAPDTVRFFESRVYGSVHFGRYFISSERQDDAPRRYKVRMADEAGAVTTPEGQPLDGFVNYAAAQRWLEDEVDGGRLPSFGERMLDARKGRK
jgi:hypothetical protein